YKFPPSANGTVAEAMERLGATAEWEARDLVGSYVDNLRRLGLVDCTDSMPRKWLPTAPGDIGYDVISISVFGRLFCEACIVGEKEAPQLSADEAKPRNKWWNVGGVCAFFGTPPQQPTNGPFHTKEQC